MTLVERPKVPRAEPGTTPLWLLGVVRRGGLRGARGNHGSTRPPSRRGGDAPTSGAIPRRFARLHYVPRPPMTPQDIEAELSYAYLHAVAAHAGIACMAAGRAHDNAGIDATLHLVHDFGPGAVLTEISLHIQLKATTKPSSSSKKGWSYFLSNVDEYDRLRANSALPPRFLAILFLPEDRTSWLKATEKQLVAQRAAYWVSLLGAPASANTSGQTVYLPKSQLLSPEGLMKLFERVARREESRYAP
jgi:hypothetical protein